LPNLSPDDHQIAFGILESRKTRQPAPVFEPGLLEQTQTRFVMPKDVAEQGARFQARRVGDRLVEKSAPNPAAPKILVHINADLDRAAIGGPGNELVETQPGRNVSFSFGNPKRKLVRRMPMKPGQTFFD
jgi:hypothetical protein